MAFCLYTICSLQDGLLILHTFLKALISTFLHNVSKSGNKEASWICSTSLLVKSKHCIANLKVSEFYGWIHFNDFHKFLQIFLFVNIKQALGTVYVKVFEMTFTRYQIMNIVRITVLDLQCVPFTVQKYGLFVIGKNLISSSV